MPLCGNRLHLQNINIFTVGATIGRPPTRRKSNPVGGHSICPRHTALYPTTRRANIAEMHLVFPQGRPLVARAPTKTKFRRGGVSPPACRAKNPSKTIPQALSRQLPLLGGAFGLCEHCKLTCGASWAPPPTGFVRTLRKMFFRSRRAGLVSPFVGI